MSQIIAINEKNQSKVNRAIMWLEKYNALDNQRNLLSDNERFNEQDIRKIERKCENAFDKYLEAISELPKREIAQIEKSDLY